MRMIRKTGISGKVLIFEASSEHSLSLAETRTNNIHSKVLQNVAVQHDVAGPRYSQQCMSWEVTGHDSVVDWSETSESKSWFTRQEWQDRQARLIQNLVEGLELVVWYKRTDLAHTNAPGYIFICQETRSHDLSWCHMSWSIIKCSVLWGNNSGK